MKQIVIIYLFSSFITYTFANQEGFLTNNGKHGEVTKSASIQKVQLDSVITYKFLNELIPERKNVFKYHPNGDVAVEELYFWEYSNINNTYSWIGRTRIEYTFSGNKPSEIINSSWNWNILDWRYTEKTTFEYNEKGQKTREYISKWNWYIINQWSNTHKNEFEYDMNGNVIIYARYRWDGDSSKWVCYQNEEFEFDENNNLMNYINNKEEYPGQPIVKTYREKNKYDDNGKLIQKVQLRWDISKEEWIETYKTENIYSSDGKQTYNAAYNYNFSANQWDRVRFTDYSYNDMGLLTQQKMMYWDSDSSKFLISNNSEYDYDANGFLIFFSSLSRNPFTKQLSGTKQEISKDPGDGSTIKIHYIWDNQEMRFNRMGKTVTQYNINNQMIKELSYEWDNMNEEFKPTNLSEYVYDDKKKFILLKRSQYSSGEWKQYSYTENEYNIMVSGEYIICPESYRTKLKYQLLKEEYLIQMFTKAMTRTTYHYSPFTFTSTPVIAEAGFRLYPNPAKDHLFIDFGPKKGDIFSNSLIFRA